MTITNADLWNLIFFGLLFIAWAMGYRQGSAR